MVTKKPSRSLAVAVVLVALSMLAIPMFSQKAQALEFDHGTWTGTTNVTVDQQNDRLLFSGASVYDWAWSVDTRVVEQQDWQMRFQFNITAYSGATRIAVGLYQQMPQRTYDGAWKADGWYHETRFYTDTGQLMERYNWNWMYQAYDYGKTSIDFTANEITVTMLCSWIEDAGVYTYGVIVKDNGVVLYSAYSYYTSAIYRDYNYAAVTISASNPCSFYLNANPYQAPPPEEEEPNATSGMEIDYVVSFVILLVPSICLGFLFGRFGLAAGLTVMSILYFVSDPTFVVPMFIIMSNSVALLWGK